MALRCSLLGLGVIDLMDRDGRRRGNSGYGGDGTGAKWHRPKVHEKKYIRVYNSYDYCVIKYFVVMEGKKKRPIWLNSLKVFILSTVLVETKYT